MHFVKSPAKRVVERRLGVEVGALEKFVRRRGKIRGTFYSTPEFRRFFSSNGKGVLAVFNLIMKYEQNLAEGRTVDVVDKQTGARIVSKSSVEGFHDTPGNNNLFIVKAVVGGFEFFVKKDKRRATEEWKIADWENCNRQLVLHGNNYRGYKVRVVKPMLVYGDIEVTPFFRNNEVCSLETFCKQHPSKKSYFVRLLKEMAHDVGLLGMDLKNVLYDEKHRGLYLVDVHG